jgi:hypothetical protein
MSRQRRMPRQPPMRPANVPPKPAAKQSRWIVALEVIGGVAALTGIISYGATALEKWHDTSAIVDLAADVDQQKPFTLPLFIKNPSSIFDMHSPTVACKFSVTYSDGGPHLATSNGGTYGLHQTSLIPAGGAAPFFCDFADKFKVSFEDSKEAAPITEGNITVTVEYQTWLFWSVKQTPPPATFNLLKTSTGFRWIKGHQIK